MFLVVFVEASPKGSLFLHLIDCAPIALPQELPRRLVLLGAPLLLQQGTGNGRDLLIIRDEHLWAKAWCQWTVKELHFLQDSRPLRFPKRHSLGGSCMCYLPGNNFFGPFYHTKKSLTIKFYRYTVVVYLPKKTCQRTPGRSRGPQRGPKGSCCSAWSSSGWRIAITALERAQSQIHEESMIQQTRCWKGHNQRVSNRAMSYLELEIHGLVAWQGNPLNSPDVFFPSTNLKKRDLQCYK